MPTDVNETCKQSVSCAGPWTSKWWNSDMRCWIALSGDTTRDKPHRLLFRGRLFIFYCKEETVEAKVITLLSKSSMMRLQFHWICNIASVYSRATCFCPFWTILRTYKYCFQSKTALTEPLSLSYTEYIKCTSTFRAGALPPREPANYKLTVPLITSQLF